MLYHCEKYQKMSPQNRHNAISQAGHCTNCLQQHLVKDCTQLCKCKHCHNTFTPKDTSLHELYNQASHSGVNLGAATSVGGPPKVSHGAAASKSCKPANTIHPPAQINVKQVGVKQLGVFTRISAVQVINPHMRASSLVYAQHDPGSQITLMSTPLHTTISMHWEA